MPLPLLPKIRDTAGEMMTSRQFTSDSKVAASFAPLGVGKAGIPGWGGLGILIPRPLIAVAFAVGFLVGISVHAGVSWPGGEAAVTASPEAKRQTPAIFHIKDSPSRSVAFPASDSVSQNPGDIGSLLQTYSVLETINSAVVRVSTESAAGSGVIIDPAGIVLTSSHVVGGWDLVTVLTPGDKPLIGDVFRVDEGAGLALVRLPPGLYDSAELGAESDISLGAPVYAIGFPLNMAGPASVTAGVVSRYFHEPASGRQLIQTDAAINIGNSGGPIVDVNGKVIGITTSILGDRPSAKTTGISFAVSIATIKDYFLD